MRKNETRRIEKFVEILISVAVTDFNRYDKKWYEKKTKIIEEDATGRIGKVRNQQVSGKIKSEV